MRIACVYVPSFSLQAALISRTVEVHSPVAVVSQPSIGAPQVLACSRAAWAAGVRASMTASVARALVPDLTCLLSDLGGTRSLVRGVGDALLGISGRVDLGGDPAGQHHVLYMDVPTGRRGSWFGAPWSVTLHALIAAALVASGISAVFIAHPAARAHAQTA